MALAGRPDMRSGLSVPRRSWPEPVMTTPSAAVARFSGLPSARALMASFTCVRGGESVYLLGGQVRSVAEIGNGEAQDYFANIALNPEMQSYHPPIAHLPASDHLSKDGVVPVQVRRGPHEDGKVALVGVGPQIGRAQQALVVVREGRVSAPASVAG